MDSAIRDGATPGNPKGPEWAQGCHQCKFGVVSQPDLWNTGVPLFIAKAMALDLDGVCYIMYCDCKAGQTAMSHDQNIRRDLNKHLRDSVVVPNLNPSARKGEMSWGSGTEPEDSIPGQWWAAVRKACEA